MTFLEKINIAKGSQVLAQLAVQKRGLYAGGLDLNQYRKISSIRKSVENIYDLDPTDSTLTKTSNFLYSLCAPFNVEAIAKITGGGSIAPISPSTTPNPYDFEVDANSFIPTGGGTVTIPEFVGYNLLFVRNNIPQSQVNLGSGSSYFNWNKVTGVFTCSPAVGETELLQLYPFV